MSNFFQSTLNKAQNLTQSIKQQGSKLKNTLEDKFSHASVGAINLNMSKTTMGPEEVHVENYHLIVKQRLAEGGFGCVDLVADFHSNQEYALKRCSVMRSGAFDVVNKEIKILQEFKGPYVVGYLASEVVRAADGQEALVLLEFCPGGHLLDKIVNPQSDYKSLSSREILKIFGQILMAVRPFHAHSPPITHRDLKLENILFSSEGSVRLCDFGSCSIGTTYLRTSDERSAAEEIIQKETTPMYRAPEMVDLYLRQQLTEKTDIWALGTMLYAMVYYSHPFQDASNLAILNCRINYPNNPNVSNDVKTLIMYMLDPDPEARPDCGTLVEMVKALFQGNSLPPYELTEEAKQRREERIKAAEIRKDKNSKTKKKQQLHPVKPQSTVPAANSVAAKRLAAKRGLAVPGSEAPHTDAPVSNQITEFAQFDNFQIPSNSTSNTSLDVDFNANRSANNFDDFSPSIADEIEIKSSSTNIKTADLLFGDDDDDDDDGCDHQVEDYTNTIVNSTSQHTNSSPASNFCNFEASGAGFQTQNDFNLFSSSQNEKHSQQNSVPSADIFFQASNQTHQRTDDNSLIDWNVSEPVAVVPETNFGNSGFTNFHLGNEVNLSNSNSETDFGIPIWNSIPSDISHHNSDWNPSAVKSLPSGHVDVKSSAPVKPPKPKRPSQNDNTNSLLEFDNFEISSAVNTSSNSSQDILNFFDSNTTSVFMDQGSNSNNSRPISWNSQGYRNNDSRPSSWSSQVSMRSQSPNPNPYPINQSSLASQPSQTQSMQSPAFDHSYQNYSSATNQNTIAPQNQNLSAQQYEQLLQQQQHRQQQAWESNSDPFL